MDQLFTFTSASNYSMH